MRGVPVVVVSVVVIVVFSSFYLNKNSLIIVITITDHTVSKDSCQFGCCCQWSNW